MKAKKMKATLTQQLETYVRCPNCGTSKGLCLTDIKEGEQFGPVSCAACGCRVIGQLKGRSVEIQYLPDKKEPAYVLVYLDKKDVPLFLIVEESDPGNQSPYDHNIHPRQIIKVIRDKSLLYRDEASRSKR